MIIMEIEVLNPYTLKIMIAARREDTISAISKRIGVSYGWTHRWILELEKLGVFERAGKKVILNEKNRFYQKTLSYVKNTFGDDVGFHYRVLSLFGIKYCFTETDAVFVWTDGGYNISRYHSYYPIFVKVNKSDRETFEYYIKKLGVGKRIFYKPLFLDDFDVEIHNEMPVDGLDETIAYMKRYVYNFQPALEMIQDMYKKDLGIEYMEAVTNV